MKKLLFTLFSFIVLKSGVAQPGSLDKTFGNNGIIISETYGGTATAVAIQPDGKIIGAGIGSYETIGGFLAVRYFPDGTLDSGFGNKGRALALTDIATVEVGGCALQEDGKLLVTGSVAIHKPGNWIDFAVARFNSDGSLDKSFGNAGSIITNVGYYDYVKAISIQGDGKIVVSGFIDELNNDDTAFAVRYNSDGSIDSTFATNGVFKFTLDDIFFLIEDHVVDKEDNLFIAGRYLFYSTVFVLKLDKDGVLDNLGHTIEEPVASLFTFNIPNNNITSLMGVSVENATVKIQSTKQSQTGAVLITHWGLSGPAVLKLSAFGAREFAALNYNFTIAVNWLPGFSENSLREKWLVLRNEYASQKISNKNPFGLPQRLWLHFLDTCEINHDTRWANLSSSSQNKLIKTLTGQEFQVKGKTTFKEEFVTCGGVKLSEIDVNTMQSKIVPNLFFAGEIMDVDGITGGFNFQHAWTSGFIAAKNIAS